MSDFLNRDIDDEEFDWYLHLEQQSSTDHIYDLIHEYIPYNWRLNHRGDYVCLDKDALPNGLVLEPSDMSEYQPAFEYDGLTLLKNDCLTEYLDRAQIVEQITDKVGRRYLLLHFQRSAKKYGKEETNSEPYYSNPERVTLAELHQAEDALWLAYELFRTKRNASRALYWAEIAQEYLERIDKAGKQNLDSYKRHMGYNIVGMVYAWNAEWEKAWQADKNYIFIPYVWNVLEEYLSRYLELLLAKKAFQYLGRLFENEGFRDHFKHHFDVFFSMVFDPEYPFKDGKRFVQILNNVRKCPKEYIDPKTYT